MSQQQEPLISVVIPVRQAAETAEDTLSALLDRPGLEVIASVASLDPTAAVLADLKRRRPELVLLEIEGSRSVPQLRAYGIRAARGRFVAITEDHCSFSPGWPQVLVAALEDPAVGAAGGAVANGRRGSPAEWAIYFSRYATLQPPMPRGSAVALPGNNACYRRELLETHRSLYEDGFREHEFHQHLQRQGLRLVQEPDAVVTHRKPYRFGPYCALRFRHGRCFGGMIRGGGSLGAVAARLLLSPLTPFLLVLRSARAVAAKRSHRREYFLALPLLLICYAAWTAGEATGYLVGPGEACSQTD
jgi:glycosyltransferase involved in cell wall biosynthesis